MARTAIHPGEHLAEQLDEIGMSAAELGRQLKVPTNRITGILNGQRAITGDSALRLAHFFGTSAEFWLSLIHADDPVFDAQLAQVLNLNLPLLKNSRKGVLDAVLEWWKREKARIAGPVSRERFVRECEKYIDGNGANSPYSPVAIWWLGQRLAKMAKCELIYNQRC